MFRANREENGRTDRHDEANSLFRNFANAPQNAFIFVAWCCRNIRRARGIIEINPLRKSVHRTTKSVKNVSCMVFLFQQPGLYGVIYDKTLSSVPEGLHCLYDVTNCSYPFTHICSCESLSGAIESLATPLHIPKIRLPAQLGRPFTLSSFVVFLIPSDKIRG
jgi:hypothetical protein